MAKKSKEAFKTAHNLTKKSLNYVTIVLQSMYGEGVKNTLRQKKLVPHSDDHALQVESSYV